MPCSCSAFARASSLSERAYSSSLARCRERRKAAAVSLQFLVERKQHARHVGAAVGEVGGKVDEVRLPLGAPHPHEPPERGVRLLLRAARPPRARAAHGGVHLLRDARRAVVGGFGQEKGVLDLAEEGGNFIQPLAHDAAVAVDGDARQNALAVEEQPVRKAGEPLFGKRAHERGGQDAGGEGKQGGGDALRERARKELRGEIGEGEGER